MTDTIRIKFPEGGCWIAQGLGMTVEEPDVQSYIAGQSAQRALISLIQPVIDAEPGDMPSTLGDNEWVFSGWDGDVAVYIEKAPVSTLDELFALMRSGTKDDWEASGLRWIDGYHDDDEGEADWSDLPTFGTRKLDGDNDLNDLCGGPLWSWDDTRAIVGNCASDIEIVNIAERADTFRKIRRGRP